VITELNWQLLAERHRIARLMMFYKIHYQLVAITMPLELKLLLMPTRMENALVYVIPSSSCDHHMYSFYPRTVREWNNLAQDVVHSTLLKPSGVHYSPSKLTRALHCYMQ